MRGSVRRIFRHPGRPTRLQVTVALCLVSLPLDARGQSMDYGALQRLFGEPVTTSATGSPQRMSVAPADMVIITQADIRRSGADNIPDILQYVAGIDVRRYSFGQSEVSVRGYDQQYSPRLLVLINGRQVYIDDYGYTAWQSLPVQLGEIRQIEVVKGPNSALFGFNAVGGVINIVTYDPLYDSVDEVTARGGTGGYDAVSGVATLRTPEQAGLRLSAGASQADQFSTAALPASLGPYGPSTRQSEASADGRLQIAPRVELTGEATLSDANGLQTTPQPAFLPVDLTTNSAKLGLAADTSAGLIDLVGYRNHSAYDIQSVSGIFGYSGGAYALDNDLYVVQAHDLLRLGPAHAVRFGLEYRDEAVSGLGPDEVGDRVLSASAMWSWTVAPEVALTNAVRVDKLLMSFKDSVLPGGGSEVDADKGSDTALSFNSGLVYTPTTTDTVRFLLARGAQAPSVTDLGLQKQIQQGGQSITLVGNPDLEPATVMSYEIDYDRSLAALRSVLTTAVYHEEIRHLLASALDIQPAVSPQGLIATSENVGSSAATGGEIALKGANAAGWRWNASYAYISITQDLLLGTLSGSSALLDYAHGSPAHVVDAGVGYRTHGIEGDLEARWQSRFTDYAPDEMDATVPIPIGSYVTMSARIAYHFSGHLTLELDGQQLAQSRLLEAAGTPVERRIYATLIASF